MNQRCFICSQNGLAFRVERRGKSIPYILHPEGIDDDSLTEVLGLKFRQQANQRCRKLESEGLVERRVVNGKIHKFWIGSESGRDKLSIKQKSFTSKKDLQEESMVLGRKHTGASCYLPGKRRLQDNECR